MIATPNTVYPRGVGLEVHPPGDYVSDVIRSTGDFYESAVLDEVRRRVTGGTLVDAGAMLGNHTVYLAAFVPHRAIHAFEPLPANAELLRRNTARFPTVTVHETALAAIARRLPFLVEGDNLGHARVDLAGPVTVEARPLDAFGLEDVTLLKVDVEGYEPSVLAGARETIARWHPLVVIEDWKREYAGLLPGYRLVAEWEQQHQTFMYEWADGA